MLFQDFKGFNLDYYVITKKTFWGTLKERKLRVDPQPWWVNFDLVVTFILQYGFWFTFKAIPLPECLEVFWVKSPNVSEINLYGSRAAFGCDFTISCPSLKAGRHLDAVSLYHPSVNHLPHWCCCCFSGISMNVSGFKFSYDRLTSSINKVVWSHFRP